MNNEYGKPAWMTMQTIPLSRSGKVAWIDNEDADLAALSWFAVDGYAARLNPAPPPVRLNLHRIIMERILSRPLALGEMVGHCNRDRLDCRRFNLRLTTRQTNGQNRPANRNSRSGYKGVSWFKAGHKWRAVLNVGSNHIVVGYFDNIRDAVVAYNQSALDHFGEIAYLNPLPEASLPADVE